MNAKSDNGKMVDADARGLHARSQSYRRHDKIAVVGVFFVVDFDVDDFGLVVGAQGGCDDGRYQFLFHVG